MKKIVILSMMAAISIDASADIGIASGPKTGTNYPMVENIVQVCSSPSLKINNVETEGSMTNLELVYRDPSAQFGIVQADAAFFQQGEDPNMMKSIKMVFPFISTDIHIIVPAGSKLQSLADLQGKRVIEGPIGSGSWITTQVIKQLTGMNWNGSPASQTDGMKAIQSGQADAQIIVAGAPVNVISNAQGIRLISARHPALDQFGLYVKTMLPGTVYPNMGQGVMTYKIPTMMVTYDFKKSRQGEIQSLVSCISNNIEKLQGGQYHPKWRSVNPHDIDQIKWTVHPAAKKIIDSVK